MKVAGLVVAGALGLGLAAGALAHAEPRRATPGDGAVLNRPPAEVVLVMTQEMARQAGANEIRVFAAAGNEVTREAAVVDPNDRRRLSVALPRDLAPGDYVVHWKTLSAEDGDTASGELRFRYDPAAEPNPGREVLYEPLLGGAPTPAPAAAIPRGGSEGTGWVLAAAVGALMLLVGIGAGVVFSRRGE